MYFGDGDGITLDPPHPCKITYRERAGEAVRHGCKSMRRGSAGFWVKPLIGGECASPFCGPTLMHSEPRRPHNHRSSLWLSMEPVTPRSLPVWWCQSSRLARWRERTPKAVIIRPLRLNNCLIKMIIALRWGEIWTRSPGLVFYSRNEPHCLCLSSQSGLIRCGAYRLDEMCAVYSKEWNTSENVRLMLRATTWIYGKINQVSCFNGGNLISISTKWHDQDPTGLFTNNGFIATWSRASLIGQERKQT